MKFVTLGTCWTEGCDCPLYDGKEVDENSLPPLHYGCVCLAIKEEKDRKEVK